MSDDRHELLRRKVDEAAADVERNPSVRLVDRLHGEGVAAALGEHDPALDDLPLADAIVWPNGDVSEVRAGFIVRDDLGGVA